MYRREKKKKHPQAGTLSVSGNKVDLESLTSLSPPKAFQGFLFLCKGWATFPRMGHSGKPCPPLYCPAPVGLAVVVSAALFGVQIHV